MSTLSLPHQAASSMRVGTTGATVPLCPLHRAKRWGSLPRMGAPVDLLLKINDGERLDGM